MTSFASRLAAAWRAFLANRRGDAVQTLLILGLIAVPVAIFLTTASDGARDQGGVAASQLWDDQDTLRLYAQKDPAAKYTSFEFTIASAEYTPLAAFDGGVGGDPTLLSSPEDEGPPPAEETAAEETPAEAEEEDKGFWDYVADGAGAVVETGGAIIAGAGRVAEYGAVIVDNTVVDTINSVYTVITCDELGLEPLSGDRLEEMVAEDAERFAETIAFVKEHGGAIVDDARELGGKIIEIVDENGEARQYIVETITEASDAYNEIDECTRKRAEAAGGVIIGLIPIGRAAKVGDKVADALPDGPPRRGGGPGRRTRLGVDCASFHGDTLVLTERGRLAIRDLAVGGPKVWARDEMTGAAAWRRVLWHGASRYDEAVNVEVKGVGAAPDQVIRSSANHPYFAVRTATMTASPRHVSFTPPPPSSQGHVYHGPIEGGAWVDAQHLRPGDRVLTADETLAEVVSVEITPADLVAYNLSVEGAPTYFVAGGEDAAAIWVHNADCWDALPDNARVVGKTGDGRDIYEFTDPATGETRRAYKGTRSDGSEGYFDPEVHPAGGAQVVTRPLSDVEIDDKIRVRPDPNDPNGLPPFTPGGKTTGRVEIDGEVVHVQSGQGYPGKALQDDPSIPTNAYSWSHAEGHAAAMMRQTGAKRATVTINHPDGPCVGCRGNLHSLVPPGGRLTVRWKDRDGVWQSRDYGRDPQ